MAEALHIGQPPVEITIKRKRNARRLTLRLASDGVFLTLPQRTPISEAQAFLTKQEGWLRQKMSERPERHSVFDAGTVPIFGEERHIVPGTGRTPKLVEDTIEIPGPPGRQPAKLQAFLKETARAELTNATDTYAAKLGLDYGKITLRDTRSRWGSCTDSGNLMYSWRLVMAPRRVLEYVAAHEVSHLAEMNHSPAYWKVVASIMPDYHIHRTWLRKHGAGLHLIDLGS